jgi:ABC-type thiamine transport system ATPase subunit
MRGMSREQRYAMARDYLRLVHLEGQEHKYPGELSGGLKQRVQIAQVLATAREMIASRELFAHIGISLQRILTGFVIGSAMAAPVGLLMGSVRAVRALLDPYTQFFRFVPSIAWLTRWSSASALGKSRRC